MRLGVVAQECAGARGVRKCDGMLDEHDLVCFNDGIPIRKVCLFRNV